VDQRSEDGVMFLVDPYQFANDAALYIAAVESADGQSLESGVANAIRAFVDGCKSDGIWTAIKACCILAGARTLTGALVPLVGAAPTGINFVSGDYNRKTGLVGNGTTKYINTNRNNNTEPRNSKHISAYVTTASTSGGSTFPGYIGAQPSSGTNQTGSTSIGRLNSNSTTLFFRAQSLAASGEFDSYANAGSATGLVGLSRSSASSYTARANNANTTFTRSSATPFASSIFVFYHGISNSYANGRIAFYSIGESLDLALLDARVTTLINAISVAIP
jgi:hypothetical protein